MVAIMGANGSGKTTLVKLLQGLYQPTDSRVLMDGADLTQFTRRNLASWIGYVPQEVFLFTGSIRDNIAKGHPDASDDEIIEAARRAGLHEHVIELPDGYGTDIGEAGRRLTGGLRQRLAIARAFVGEPPVIILDEPSSNLDRDGEQALAKGLRALAAEGRTVIVVSHSAAMLTASDQILVLQKGRLVRAGRPEDVLPQLLATPVRAAKPAAAPGAGAKARAGAPAAAASTGAPSKPKPAPIGNAAAPPAAAAKPTDAAAGPESDASEPAVTGDATEPAADAPEPAAAAPAGWSAGKRMSRLDDLVARHPVPSLRPLAWVIILVIVVFAAWASFTGTGRGIDRRGRDRAARPSQGDPAPRGRHRPGHLRRRGGQSERGRSAHSARPGLGRGQP